MSKKSSTTVSTSTAAVAGTRTPRVLTPGTEVSIWDGVTRATYIVGTKKHAKAVARMEAHKAARVVRTPEEKAAKQAANKAQAAWMRENGLVPSGSAWTAVSKGERDVTALKGMNAADGLAVKTPASKAPVEAPKKAQATEAEVVAFMAESGITVPTGKKAGKKAAKKAAQAEAEAKRAARAEAARKGWETRRANAAQAAPVEAPVEAPAVEPLAEPVVEAAPKAPKGKKARFWAACAANGLTDDAVIAATWDAVKAAL